MDAETLKPGVADDCPTPESMEDLVRLLREAMGDNGLDELDARGLQRVATLMESYKSRASDWKKYANYDPYRYTRNLVDDGNGRFNLLVLAWSEGQGSAIHDHAGSHCLMKILDGTLVETRYAWPDEHSSPGAAPLKRLQSEQYQRDQVAYICDKIGLHRVENPSHSDCALSLHLYTPPYAECKTFNEATGTARASGKLTFYTIRGERVSCPPPK